LSDWRLDVCSSDWGPYLHAWVVTRYEEVVTVLTKFLADRTPPPEYFEAPGAPAASPPAKVMVKQMLFLDAPAHTRLRKLAGAAFVPARIRVLRDHIQDIATRLIDAIQARGTGRLDCLPTSPSRCRPSSRRSCSACRSRTT